MKQQTPPEGDIGFSSTAGAGEPHRPSAAIKLASDLGIEDAAVLHGILAPRVSDDGAVSFDAADVQRIHTAALQLFCMFCHDRRSAGRETRWLKPSAALRSAAALLGATTLLSLGTT